MIVYLVMLTTSKVQVPYRIYRSRAAALRFIKRKSLAEGQSLDLVTMSTED